MRQWIAIGAAACLVAISLPHVRQHGQSFVTGLSKGKLSLQGGPIKREITPPALSDLDLTKIDARDEIVTARAHGERIAELTLDAKLQRAANRLLREGALPMGAIVVTDVKTGRVLAWSNYSEDAPLTNLAAEASAPSASIFKIVTGAGLVEKGLTPNTKECYHGGKSRVDDSELVRDPQRDKWCATLSEAMGRSLNVVMARLALEQLDKDALTSIATRLGWGRSIPFDVPIQVSKLDLPDEPNELARSAAGFWHTNLSAFQGANLATTIANDGEMIRLHVVDKVRLGEEVLYEGPKERQVLDRVIDAHTARAVTTMMQSTIDSGTSFKSFHDRNGKPYLPGVRVAGKTGTLAENKLNGYLYTWFVGFAPSDAPEVAISVLAANRAAWRVKATTVAAQLLRTYFAGKGVKGVTDPYVTGG